jgi:hypothetical protein
MWHAHGMRRQRESRLASDIFARMWRMYGACAHACRCSTFKKTMLAMLNQHASLWFGHSVARRHPPETTENMASGGPRPGPESGMGWASALRWYTLGIYLTPSHPSSHLTSRACPHGAHFIPCCMRGSHAMRGRCVQAGIAPPRAAGLSSSNPWVDGLPPMAGCPGGVR